MATVVGLRRTRNSGTGFAAGCRCRRRGRWSACRLFVANRAVKSIKHDAKNHDTDSGHKRNRTGARSSEAQPQHRIGLGAFLRRQRLGHSLSGMSVLGSPALVQSAFGHCHDPFVMTIPAPPTRFPGPARHGASASAFKVPGSLPAVNPCLTEDVSRSPGPRWLLNFHWFRRFRLAPIRTAFRTRNACRDRPRHS